MLDALAGGLGTVILLLGLALATIGLYGMLRRPDIFEQLHAAGLVTGPGVILVLLASLAVGRTETVTSALLVIAFILVTSSLSTHTIALTAWRRRQAAPQPPDGATGSLPPEEPAAGPARGPRADPMRVVLAVDGSPSADAPIELAAATPWPPDP